MSYEPEPDPARRFWRVVFGSFLALALIVGLGLSLRAPDPGLFFGTTPAPTTRTPAAAPPPVATTPPTPAPVTATPTVDPTPAEELIAAARDPAETSVQVLDAGGGGARTGDVVDRLEELGYQVVNVTSSRVDTTTTTVLYTDGAEAEARALRARDQRFTEIGPNDRLSEGVDLHVLVAPDWD